MWWSTELWSEVLLYLSVVALLRRVAHIRGVGQHVGPVDVVDGLGLGQRGQVLVVQHLLAQLGLKEAETERRRKVWGAWAEGWRQSSGCWGLETLRRSLCWGNQRHWRPGPRWCSQRRSGSPGAHTHIHTHANTHKHIKYWINSSFCKILKKQWKIHQTFQEAVQPKQTQSVFEEKQQNILKFELKQLQDQSVYTKK